MWYLLLKVENVKKNKEALSSFLFKFNNRPPKLAYITLIVRHEAVANIESKNKIQKRAKRHNKKI